MSLPLAHISGIPIEETLGSLSPALLLAFGVASATLRARLRRARGPASHDGLRPGRRRRSIM